MTVNFSDVPEFAGWFQETFGVKCEIMKTPVDVFYGVPVSAMTRAASAIIPEKAIDDLKALHGIDDKKVIVEVLKLALQAEEGNPFEGVGAVFAYQAELVRCGATDFRIKFRYGVINKSDRGGMADTLS